MSERRFRVVVTSRSFGKHVTLGRRVLDEAGCDVVMKGQGAPWDEETMCALVRDADAVIVGVDPVTRRVMEAGPRLRVVAKHGVGVDNIDLSAAEELGIAVTYAPGASADAVAEMTIALLFALWRGVVGGDQAIHERRWEPFVGREVRGRTLGVVGLGRIGKAVARLARRLGMQVLACDVVQDAAFAAAEGIHFAGLEDVLRTADAVSIHVPLTAATRYLIGPRELGWMRRDAVLINMARGGVVDEHALAQALADGRLAGAAVDVFAREPPWESPLLDAPNTVLTPHVGAHTLEAMERVDVMVARDVAAVLHGDRPAHPVPLGPPGM